MAACSQDRRHALEKTLDAIKREVAVLQSVAHPNIVIGFRLGLIDLQTCFSDVHFELERGAVYLFLQRVCGGGTYVRYSALNRTRPVFVYSRETRSEGVRGKVHLLPNTACGVIPP